MKTASIPAARARKTRSSRRPAAAVAAFAGGCLLLVLAAVEASKLPWQEMRQHLAARTWPEAPATIRSVSLSERSYLAAGERLSTEMLLDVSYEYEVDGVLHEGRRASFDDRAEPHDRRLRALYSRLNFALVTGRSVPAFYDPDAPGEAVLDIQFDWRRLGLGFGGGLAVSGGLVGLWLVLSPFRGRRPAVSR